MIMLQVRLTLCQQRLKDRDVDKMRDRMVVFEPFQCFEHVYGSC